MDTKEIFLQVEIIRILLREELPEIYRNFEKQGVKHQIFVLDWFITLFSKSFSVDVATRLWDRYFLEGETFLYTGTLGVLRYFKEKLKNAPFEESMQFLSHLPRDDIDIDKLFQCIDNVSLLTRSRLDKIKLDAEQIVKNYYYYYYADNNKNDNEKVDNKNDNKKVVIVVNNNNNNNNK